MTDLEQNWDDLPVGPAPVDAVLRDAHRQAASERRRRPEARLKRSLTAVAVLGGVAAAFVAGTIVSAPGPDDSPGSAGGYGSGAGSGGDLATPVAFQGELQAPESCDDLLQHYVERGVDLVSEYGWGGSGREYYTRGLDDMAFDGGLRLEQFADAPLPTSAGAMPRGGFAPRTARAESSDTGTNVQEAGVDEPDSVKTDGRLLVRLRGAELTTYDVSGSEEDGVVRLGSLDLGDFYDGEILLSGETVVAVGNDGTRPAEGMAVYDDFGYEQPSPQTRVLTIDLDDPASPVLRQTVDYDAALVATRQHGADVRVVLSKGLPDLPFDDDDAGTENGTKALKANRELVEESTLDDWLPHVSVDGGEPTDLLACDRVAIPRAEIGLSTMAVVGFGAAAPGETDAFGLAGDAPLTYESADHLYLAATGASTSFDGCFDCLRRTSVGGRGPDGTTHVYDFALDGTSASYVGAGEVEGYVRDRWSMDEKDGVLRVAVGPSTETDNANSIVTLRAEDDELVEVGRLDRLGVGEDIKAVRWFDDLALLVTFRQVDPLYAVDLSDPADPTLVGELKIPGFSSYLHPLGTMRVVGVGSDGRGGAQAGLFDVTDLTDPRQLDVTSYGRNTYAKAGDDPRQFTWLPDQRIVLTVVAQGGTGYVSRLQLGGGKMANKMTRVEYGSDIDAVRLVPVGGGKVAVVTGEDVEYFDLD
ncbi:beta-propeller domain-containing protein [Nocardioides sp.]|uniref:beta-propeller domain-containing protein n=1 Tax=Nocardioides sp. TaxID=35761 RepID=UPI0027167C37|nr:beta-propeller domain-containing protein [Nocardioides sp.]MDO9455352.1 beta-propeller domain-containing protein [Nocardioides sp.]